MSDSDSSSDSDEEMLDVKIDVSSLEERIKANPADYEAHTELVSSLRKAREVEALQKARDAFSAQFPLTDDLWLEWIQDEKRIAASSEEIETLFERALGDYISVNLLLAYCEHVFESAVDGESKESIAKARSTYERALTLMGVNVAEGNKLWDSILKFEIQVLQSAKTNLDDQRKFVRKLWMRRCALPLLGMETTLADFAAWEAEIGGEAPAESTAAIFLEALKGLELRAGIELDLAKFRGEGDAVHLHSRWLEYIALEENSKEFGRLKCVYERALKDCCLYPAMWLSYGNFALATLKDAHLAANIFQRAIRNCPWDSSLWALCVSAMERARLPYSKIKSVFIGCARVPLFSSGAEFSTVCSALLDAARRLSPGSSGGESSAQFDIRAEFESTVSTLETLYPGTEEENSYSLTQYWAWVEHSILKDSARAEKLVLTKIVEKTRAAAVLLDSAKTLKNWGCVSGARSVYQKAMKLNSADTQALVMDWLTFERENGSLANYDAVYHRATKYFQHATKTSESQQTAAQKRAEEEAKKLKLKEEKLAKKKEKKKDKKSEGADGQGETEAGEGEGGRESGSKRAREDGEGAAAKKPRAAAAVLDSAFTVFVSNLAPTTDEEAIRSVFSYKAGPVGSIRLMKTEKGESRGFAYVDMETQEAFEAALSLNRTAIQDHVIKVARSKPHTQGEVRNVLFVRGLHESVGDDDLSLLFKPCGEVKDVRIVRDHSGVSRGFSYVEFNSDAEAKKGLMMNGLVLKGKKIDVAISNPSKKGSNAPPPRHFDRHDRSFTPAQTHESATQDAQERKAPRPVSTAPMVPSSLRHRKVSIVAPVRPRGAPANTSAVEEPPKPAAPAEGPKMSNKDFALLFAKSSE